MGTGAMQRWRRGLSKLYLAPPLPLWGHVSHSTSAEPRWASSLMLRGTFGLLARNPPFVSRTHSSLICSVIRFSMSLSPTFRFRIMGSMMTSYIQAGRGFSIITGFPAFLSGRGAPRPRPVLPTGPTHSPHAHTPVRTLPLCARSSPPRRTARPWGLCRPVHRTESKRPIIAELPRLACPHQPPSADLEVVRQGPRPLGRIEGVVGVPADSPLAPSPGRAGLVAHAASVRQGGGARFLPAACPVAAKAGLRRAWPTGDPLRLQVPQPSSRLGRSPAGVDGRQPGRR